MQIPADCDSGQLLVMGYMVCESCGDCVPFQAPENGITSGMCGCGRKWFVRPQAIQAYYLTPQQLAIQGEVPPERVQHRSASIPESAPTPRSPGVIHGGAIGGKTLQGARRAN